MDNGNMNFTKRFKSIIEENNSLKKEGFRLLNMSEKISYITVIIMSISLLILIKLIQVKSQ